MGMLQRTLVVAFLLAGAAGLSVAAPNGCGSFGSADAAYVGTSALEHLRSQPARYTSPGNITVHFGDSSYSIDDLDCADNITMCVVLTVECHNITASYADREDVVIAEETKIEFLSIIVGSYLEGVGFAFTLKDVHSAIRGTILIYDPEFLDGVTDAVKVAFADWKLVVVENGTGSPGDI